MTGEALASLPKAGREDVRRAADAAEEAQPRLARLWVKDRAAMAVRVAEAIRPNIDRGRWT